jgi:hypothetical protein
MANAGHGITHAEEIDVMVGHGVFRLQLRDRDVEKAADQGGKEQENRSWAPVVGNGYGSSVLFRVPQYALHTIVALPLPRAV